MTLYGTAEYATCAMCDEPKCIGKHRCPDLQKTLERLKKEYPDLAKKEHLIP